MFRCPILLALSLSWCINFSQDGTPDSAPASKPASAPAISKDDLTRFETAGKYTIDAGSYSFLVRKGGAIVHEQYEKGTNAESAYALASGTKSFWGVCAIAMLADGIVTSLDEKVCETVTEWKEDPQKSQITIRMLLQLQAGFPAEQEKYTGLRIVNKYESAIGEPLEFAPGERFRYGAVSYYAFGAFAKRKLKGEDPLAYVNKRVLEPIGLKIGKWTRDAAGNPNMPHGASLNAREWSKFGELLKNGGKWNGKEVLPAKLISELSRPSPKNPAYGMTFWRALAPPDEDGTSTSRPASAPSRLRDGPADAPKERAGNASLFTLPNDTFFAAGLGGQLCVMIPSRDLVVVRLGPLRGGTFDRNEMLKLLLQ